jgi:hypothetical protein
MPIIVSTANLLASSDDVDSRAEDIAIGSISRPGEPER